MHYIFIFMYTVYVCAGVVEIIMAVELYCCKTSTAEQATESVLIDLDVI